MLSKRTSKPPRRGRAGYPFPTSLQSSLLSWAMKRLRCLSTKSDTRRHTSSARASWGRSRKVEDRSKLQHMHDEVVFPDPRVMRLQAPLANEALMSLPRGLETLGDEGEHLAPFEALRLANPATCSPARELDDRPEGSRGGRPERTSPQ